VTTGLPAMLHLEMIIFCARATFSPGISTPMSPRATYRAPLASAYAHRTLKCFLLTSLGARRLKRGTYRTLLQIYIAQCAASGNAEAFACGLAHHDAVGHFEDFVKVFQALLVLDLGDDLNVLATIFVEVLCMCVYCVCVCCMCVCVCCVQIFTQQESCLCPMPPGLARHVQHVRMLQVCNSTADAQTQASSMTGRKHGLKERGQRRDITFLHGQATEGDAKKKKTVPS